MSESDTRVRLDRWLWAARFFKTRSQAAAATDGGKVQLNGVRVKRSRLVQVGDTVRIRKPPYEWVVEIAAVSEHRRGAGEARRLYAESPESTAARERLRMGLRMQSVTSYDKRGRPTKRERRQIDRLKRGED